jgi:hypothetical protein
MHSGSEVAIEARNAFGIVVMRGNGRINGHDIHVTYWANYPPPVTGEGRGRISADGMLIRGTFVDPVMGAQPVELYRTG